ncbi:hypothetical protein LXL04_025237 [Taraxacum kok-saghyz]
MDSISITDNSQEHSDNNTQDSSLPAENKSDWMGSMNTQMICSMNTQMKIRAIEWIHRAPRAIISKHNMTTPMSCNLCLKSCIFYPSCKFNRLHNTSNELKITIFGGKQVTNNGEMADLVSHLCLLRHRTRSPPQTNLDFFFPNQQSSDSCLSDFQSNLSSISIPQIFSTCLTTTTEFVAFPSNYTEIVTLSEGTRYAAAALVSPEDTRTADCILGVTLAKPKSKSKSNKTTIYSILGALIGTLLFLGAVLAYRRHKSKRKEIGEGNPNRDYNMSNIAKFEFPALEANGKNYMPWTIDVEMHLESMGIRDTINFVNDCSL